MTAMTSAATIPTPHGTFVAQFNDVGLYQLDFPGRSGTPKVKPKPVGLTKRWLAATAAALESLQSVWTELLNIPLGQICSYGEIAGRLAKPGAARAVGSACGANPIPVIIPCHRVLPAHRRTGGFSGGLGWKQRLLRIEGAEFVAD